METKAAYSQPLYLQTTLPVLLLSFHRPIPQFPIYPRDIFIR